MDKDLEITTKLLETQTNIFKLGSIEKLKVYEYAVPKELVGSQSDNVIAAHQALISGGILASWCWDTSPLFVSTPACGTTAGTAVRSGGLVSPTSSVSPAVSPRTSYAHHQNTMVMSQQSPRPNTPTTSIRHTIAKPRKKLFVFVSDASDIDDPITDKTKENVGNIIEANKLSFVSESEYDLNNTDATHHLFAAITAVTGKNLCKKSSFVNLGNSTFVHKPTTYLSSKHGKPEDCGLVAITLSYFAQNMDIYLCAKITKKNLWPLLLSDVPKLRPLSIPVVIGGCGAPGLLQDIISASDVEYNNVYSAWEGIIPSLRRNLFNKPLSCNLLLSESGVTHKNGFERYLGSVKIGNTTTLFPLDVLFVFRRAKSSRVSYVKDLIRMLIPLTISPNENTKMDYWTQEPIMYHVCKNTQRQKESRSGNCTPHPGEMNTPNSHIQGNQATTPSSGLSNNVTTPNQSMLRNSSMSPLKTQTPYSSEIQNQDYQQQQQQQQQYSQLRNGQQIQQEQMTVQLPIVQQQKPQQSSSSLSSTTSSFQQQTQSLYTISQQQEQQQQQMQMQQQQGIYSQSNQQRQLNGYDNTNNNGYNQYAQNYSVDQYSSTQVAQDGCTNQSQYQSQTLHLSASPTKQQVDQPRESTPIQSDFFGDITSEDIRDSDINKNPKRKLDNGKYGNKNTQPKNLPFYLEPSATSNYLSHESSIEFSNKEFPEVSVSCTQTIPTFIQSSLCKYQDRLSPASTYQPQYQIAPYQCGIQVDYQQGFSPIPGNASFDSGSYGCITGFGPLSPQPQSRQQLQQSHNTTKIDGSLIISSVTTGDECMNEQYTGTEIMNDNGNTDSDWEDIDSDSSCSDEDDYEFDDDECIAELNKYKNTNDNSNKGRNRGQPPHHMTGNRKPISSSPISQQQITPHIASANGPACGTRMTDEMALSLQEADGSSGRFAALLSSSTSPFGDNGAAPEFPITLTKDEVDPSCHTWSNIMLLFQDMAFSDIENPVFDHASTQRWSNATFGPRPGLSLLPEEIPLFRKGARTAKLSLIEDVSSSPALQHTIDPITEEAAPEVFSGTLNLLGQALSDAFGRNSLAQRLRGNDFALKLDEISSGASRLATPVLVAGTKKNWIEYPPKWVALWDRMHIYPYSLQKDIRYYVLCPEGKEPYADMFFKNLATTYENNNLGTHIPGTKTFTSIPKVAALGDSQMKEGDEDSGSDVNEERYVLQYMAKAQALGKEIKKSFDKYSNTSVVVYFVNPFSGKGSPDRSFQNIAQCMVALRDKVQVAPVVTEEIPMSLILGGPCDSTLLREISFAVFNKVKRIEAEYSCQTYANTPPHPIYEPYTILSPLNPVRDMGHVHCTQKIAHFAYAISDDGKWIASTMTDAYGEILETFLKLNKQNNTSTSTSSSGNSNGNQLESTLNTVLNLWRLRLLMTKHKGWEIVITKYGILTAAEKSAWEKVLGSARLGKLSEVADYVCVCSLRMLPDLQVEVPHEFLQNRPQSNLGDAPSFVVPLKAPICSEVDFCGAAEATAQAVVISPAPDIFFRTKQPVSYSVLTHVGINISGGMCKWDNHSKLCVCVAKRMNALSWLNISPSAPLRKSVLPFHVVIAKRLAQISAFVVPVYKSVLSFSKKNI